MDILHPVHIGLGEALGNEFYPSVLNDLDGRLGKRLHLNKPLRAGERLDDRAAAVAAADVMIIRLDLHKIALLLKVSNDGLSRLIAVHAVVLAAVYDLRVLIDNKDLLKAVAQSDLIVVGVMAGRHFNGAGAKAELNIVVGHDGKLPSDERQYGVFADKVSIALIVRVDGDAGVAQHGLRPGGGDDKFLIGVLDGVSDMPEKAGHVLVLDLGVGQGRAALGAPVYDSAPLVDKSLFIQLTEGLTHRFCAGLVHGEGAPVPVAGGAQNLLLLNNAVAVLVLPVPHAVKKLFAAEVVAGEPLVLAKLLLDLYLRRYTGMIGAGKPQGGIALHPLVPDEDILQSGIESVSHVKLSRYVGWRHYYRERLLFGIDNTLEVPALLPHIVDLLFHRGRVINFR